MSFLLVVGCSESVPVATDGGDRDAADGSTTPSGADLGTARPPEGIRGADGCLRAAPPRAGAFASYASDYDGWSREPLTVGERVIVRVGFDQADTCLAALQEDGSVDWSFVLDHGLGYEARVDFVRGELSVLLVGTSEIRHLLIDPAAGRLTEVGSAALEAGSVPEHVRFVTAPTGELLVVWNRSWRIGARVFDRDWTPLGPTVTVTDDGRYPRLVAFADGYAVAFHQLLGDSVHGPTILRLGRDGSVTSPPIHPDGLVYGGSALRFHPRDGQLLAVWRVARTEIDTRIRYAPLNDALEPAEEPIDLSSGDRRLFVSAAFGTRGLLVGIDTAFSMEGGYAFLATGSATPRRVLRDPMAGVRVGWDADEDPLVFWRDLEGMHLTRPRLD